MKTLLQKTLLLILSSCLSMHLASQNNFTIIAMPDTQHYTDVPENEAIFANQTQWIVDNKDALNIVFVTGLGDITQNGNDDDEWQIADEAYDLIEDPTTTMLTYGIPYGLSVGNHDQFPFGDPDPPSTSKFNEYFGTARFTGRTYYGGHYGSDNDNSYQLFSAGGMDFIVIHFEYDTSPDAAVLNWADGLLTTYSNRRAIVSTHYMIGNGNPASWGSQGQAIYNALSDHENLFLMLGGHLSTEGMREDTGPNNNVIYTLLSDYQNLSNGGNGWLRIMEFSPANNEITVTTYSPWLNQYGTDTEMDGNSTSAPFTLAYDMGGSPPPTVELQDGLNGYDGTRDTYLYDDNPSTVRGGETTFVQDKNPSDDRTSLLLFDLTSIPSGSTVNSAELEFYVHAEGQGFNMHRMLQSWDEATITFTSNGGHFAPNGTDAEVAVDANWPGDDGYQGFITVTVPAATIQDWLDGAMPNNGWLMIATHASDGQQLRSREHTTQADRPKLTVDYTPPPGPTISVTGTPLTEFSSSPGVPSAQQSYTVSGSNLTANIGIAAPTDFEISTTSGSGFGSNLVLTQSGGSVSPTTIYARFNRAITGASSGDISHTSTGATTENVAVSGVACASTVETEVFQDGQNSYSGTRDTYLWDSSPGTVRGSEVTFIQDINNTNERRSLLSFDLASIPPGNTVLSAELEFYVDTEGQGFNMHRMLKPWSESTTYTSNGGHFDADDVDAEVAVDANWPGVDTYTGFITVTVPASSIQDWVEGNLINDGWLMIATHGSDGQQLTSREENTNTDRRPKLTLEVCLDAPLPIELTDFQVKKDGKNSFIFWETATEINNAGFEIQKSHDGLRWEKLTWLDGQGTTNLRQFYSFIDEQPYSGFNYYRLRQVDFDDAETYSDIRVLNFESADEKAIIFPNPVLAELTVNMPESINGKVIFEIQNALGRVLTTEEINLEERVHKINTSDLVSGIYYLNIQSESFSGSYPFVKND